MAIKAFVNGRDIFVRLPTGFAGKSQCYASLPTEVTSSVYKHLERSL